jgi:hypothetical protein
MADAVALAHFKEALVFLGTAAIVVPLFRRLRISPVIGFICAGILLGPSGLGQWAKTLPVLKPFTFSDVEDMHMFAELGVVFLLFMIGLELSFARLLRLRKLVFGLGALQVAVCALVLAGLALLLAMGLACFGGLVIARALMVHGCHFRGFTEGRRFVPSLHTPSFGSVRVPAFSERFSFFPEQHIGRLRGRLRGLALVWVGMVVTPLI